MANENKPTFFWNYHGPFCLININVIIESFDYKIYRTKLNINHTEPICSKQVHSECENNPAQLITYHHGRHLGVSVIYGSKQIMVND